MFFSRSEGPRLVKDSFVYAPSISVFTEEDVWISCRLFYSVYSAHQRDRKRDIYDLRETLELYCYAIGLL